MLKATAPRQNAYALYVVLILTLANILSIADRSVMGLLLEPVKRDLHASDTAMSLLTGAAFVVFYSLLGIPIARWCDRGDRRGILAIGVLLWSVMTAACGMAGSFVVMALARAGVGIGEATCTPASMSLISDYFARKGRPRMIALFNLALPLSAVLVTPLAGLINDHYGWRAAFIALAVPGVIVALLVRLTVKEPVRGGLDDRTDRPPTGSSLAAAIRTMWVSKPFMLLFIGAAITGLGVSTLGAWGPALAMRAYHVSATKIAAIQGGVGAIGGLIGGLGGGFLNTWVADRRGSQRWIVLLPALMALVTIPAGVLYATAPTFSLQVVAMFVAQISTGFRIAPFMALSLEFVPANHRGMASAATLIATSVFGQAFGPLAVGLISDHLTVAFGPVSALRYAMLLAPATMLLGAIPFFMLLRYFNRDGPITADP